MNLIVALFVWILVVACVCWIVSLIPLPGSPPFLRNVLYLLVAVVALLVLLDLVGWADLGLGWHPVGRSRR